MTTRSLLLPLACTAVLSFLLAACDSQAVEDTAQITVKIGQYTAAFDEDTEAEVPEIGHLTIATENAVDLARMPRKVFRISVEGYSSSQSGSDIPEHLRNTVYLLFDRQGPPANPRLSGVFPVPPSWAGKTEAVSDSVDMAVYAFVLERPGLVYPDTLVIKFGLDGHQESLEVIPSRHMVRLDQQVQVSGRDFAPLPAEEGLIFAMTSDEVDASLYPCLLVHGIEVVDSDTVRTLPHELDIVGFVAGTRREGREYGRLGASQLRIAQDSEFRLFVLRRD